MKKAFYLLMIVGLVSCKSENTDAPGEVKSKLAQGGADSDLPAEGGTTTLAFDKMEHDFGNVRVGQDYTYKFKVTNTGKSPLVIEDAKASCGCTVPDKPVDPIAPGKSDEIVVTFSPKPGQGVTSKTITVTANTNPKITSLVIKANVIENMANNKLSTTNSTDVK
jgi:hypothetical protein